MAGSGYQTTTTTNEREIKGCLQTFDFFYHQPQSLCWGFCIPAKGSMLQQSGGAAEKTLSKLPRKM
jgi:hypothetical protein